MKTSDQNRLEGLQTQPPSLSLAVRTSSAFIQLFAFWFPFAAFSGAPPSAGRCRSSRPRFLGLAASLRGGGSGNGRGRVGQGGSRRECGQATALRRGQANTAAPGSEARSFTNEKKLLPTWAGVLQHKELRSPAGEAGGKGTLSLGGRGCYCRRSQGVYRATNNCSSKPWVSEHPAPELAYLFLGGRGHGRPRRGRA